MKIDRDELKGSGWKMGACFTKSNCPQLVALMDENHSRDDSFIYIAITHDCAIINPCLVAEPFLEYIVAWPIAKLDGNCTHTKNPRKLHLHIDIEDSAKPFELNIIDRGFLSRELLLKNKPDQKINIKKFQKNTLVRWLANRYMGQALPDLFEKRIDPVREKLNKHLSKTEANGMLAMYISLDTKELTNDVSYDLKVALVYEDAAINTLIDEDRLVGYVTKIEEVLNLASGINVSGVIPLSEKDFTLYQQRRMLRWRSDHLSFKQNSDDVEIIEDP